MTVQRFLVKLAWGENIPFIENLKCREEGDKATSEEKANLQQDVYQEPELAQSQVSPLYEFHINHIAF